MSESSAIAALVSRARSGDVDAFEQLARRYAPMVHAVALQVVGDARDAQDVAQRALLSAWQGLDSFRGDAGFSTWLYQITRRHALNSVSRTARTALWPMESDPPLPHSDPAELASEQDEAATVRAAVAALPDGERRVVHLFHFQRLSYAQIAVATHSTEPAVRSRLFRARRTLAASLSVQR